MWVVYVIGPVDGPYKVGVSSSPHQRLASLQIGYPLELILYGVRRAENKTEAMSLERHIHNELIEYNAKGEWFYCDLNIVKKAVRAAKFCPRKAHLSRYEKMLQDRQKLFERVMVPPGVDLSDIKKPQYTAIGQDRDKSNWMRRSNGLRSLS